MSRLIETPSYGGNFSVAGDIGFTVPAGKIWIVSQLTTQIFINAAGATNLIGYVYTKGGLRLHEIFNKGSAAVQTVGEKWDAATGLILVDEDQIRFFSETDTAGVRSFLDVEEFDE